MLLSNLRVSLRLALAIAIPLCALAWFAGAQLLQTWSLRADASKLGLLADGASRISRLVHELQKERGSTAGFLASQGRELRDAVKEVRTLVNVELKSFEHAVSSLRNANSGAIDQALKQARAGLGELEAKRTTIDALSLSPAEAVAFYTQTIASLLNAVESISAATSHRELALGVSAYVDLVGAKEFAGQERALGSAGIAARKFGPQEYVRYAGLGRAQDVLVRRFLAAASPAQREFFEKTLAGSVSDNFAKSRDVILNGGLSGEFQGLDAKGWFGVATVRLNALKTVEDRVSADLIARASTIFADAHGALTFWGTIVGLVMAATVLIAYLLARSVTRPLTGLTSAMGRLASGDLQVEVANASRGDEIGAMARAVQTFKDAAIEKVRLERDAAQQRQQAETERAARELEKAEEARQAQATIEGLAQGLDRLAHGDLLYQITTPFAPNAEQLRTDFNAAVDKLKQTMLAVVASMQGIRSGTQEITTASDDLARRTEQQAAGLEETAAALEEITAAVKKAAGGASHAREVVATAKHDAEKSGEVVRKAVEAMGGIEKSSQQIGQIIGVIDEIAFQTNLLALNAGVEAARAGDAGRGFAVVASEVRALAQRSAEAAKEIKGLISTSTGQVSQGVELVAETGKSLERIITQVAEINGVVSDIAAGSQEQSTGLQQINTAINQMDQVTQQNAAMVEESTAASHALSQEADHLSQLLGQFQVGGQGSAQPAARKSIEVPAQRNTAKVPSTALKSVSGRRASVAERNVA
jgi:methyl-accepting chemotaxis protein